jgi:alpha-1,2-mannosyltransferase
LLFAVLTTVNALNKGGDAAVFFEGGRRLLHAEPLYAGSSAADGFIGPPFQALFFAPFAAIAARSPVTAKLLWHALNLGCLAAGVALTIRWWNAVRARAGLEQRPWLALAGAPLAALLLPLLTNFEHQNLNALLLALLAAATWQLSGGSMVVAGVLVGAATALKAFPALLIVYLLARRNWTAAVAAIVTAGALSVAPLPVYGVDGFADLARTFLRLSTSGWPVRGNNQSLIAAIDRYTADGLGDAGGVRQMADTPIATGLFIVVALLLGAALAWSVVRRPAAANTVAVEITAVTVIAVLLSPIAWDHYWTLLLPAYLVVYDSRDSRVLGQPGSYAFWAAAILTTGLSPLTLGASGFAVARELSTYTIAALVLYAVLLTLSRALLPAPALARHEA